MMHVLLYWALVDFVEHLQRFVCLLLDWNFNELIGEVRTVVYVFVEVLIGVIVLE